MKHSISLIILLFIAANAYSQDSILSFSIDEAKEYALKHNKTILNAASDLHLANEQYKEARGNGLPQVSGSMDYMTNFGYEFEFGIGGTGSTTPPEINYALLDYGDYEIIKFLNQMMAPSEPSTIVMEDQANASIQISQLIYSRQFWIGLQMAKIGKKLAEKNIILTELDVKETVSSSYYLILVSEELLKIIEVNQNNLKDVLKHTSDMFKAGIAEQTDVDQIRISLTQLENSKRAMERNLKLNYNMLKFLLSVDLEKELVLKNNLDIFLNEIENYEIFNVKQDLSENPSLHIMETQLELSEKNLDLQKWAYGPTLSGFYSHKEKLLTTGFDLSPKDAAGLTLSIPIYSGGSKKAKVNQAEIELDKVRRNKSMLNEQISLQENQLIFDLESAFENYKTQKENVNVANRMYTNINNKYKQGLVSSLDLTQANSNLSQAENNYISSILEVLMSKLKLDKLYNNL